MWVQEDLSSSSASNAAWQTTQLPKHPKEKTRLQRRVARLDPSGRAPCPPPMTCQSRLARCPCREPGRTARAMKTGDLSPAVMSLDTAGILLHNCIRQRRLKPPPKSVTNPPRGLLCQRVTAVDDPFICIEDKCDVVVIVDMDKPADRVDEAICKIMGNLTNQEVCELEINQKTGEPSR
ncbi:hypothetical protein OH76DRAFT_1079378 [Lentinus brumalis]|uniref:Uncharacterized protein n=1 Tax=Lentinus brumalis TaxID=2498619 RepID=A0A371DP40_9APHY|nr:hypothetical protein OH76DRAFT_1079378 [Polyporus brumalis]